MTDLHRIRGRRHGGQAAQKRPAPSAAERGRAGAGSGGGVGGEPHRRPVGGLVGPPEVGLRLPGGGGPDGRGAGPAPDGDRPGGAGRLGQAAGGAVRPPVRGDRGGGPAAAGGGGDLPRRARPRPGRGGQRRPDPGGAPASGGARRRGGDHQRGTGWGALSEPGRGVPLQPLRERAGPLGAVRRVGELHPGGGPSDPDSPQPRQRGLLPERRGPVPGERLLPHHRLRPQRGPGGRGDGPGLPRPRVPGGPRHQPVRLPGV